MFTPNYEPQQLPKRLKQAAMALLIFLCVFIPFRLPLADLTFSGIKAIPDLLVLALAVWYAIAVRFRFRFLLHDLLFAAFLLLGSVSAVLVNGNSISLAIYQIRSLGVYYILYFVIRNFGFGRKEFITLTRVLQGVSLPIFVLALIEKITSKTVLFSDALAKTIDKINFSRVYSTFQNPNTYGLFLVFIIVFSIAIWYTDGKKTPVWLYCTLGSALYMTMSRSSVIILIAILAAVFLLAVLGRQVKIAWKRFIPSLLCILAVSIAVGYGSNPAAKAYYDLKARYDIVSPLSPTQKEKVTVITYTTPTGETMTGYVFFDHVYTDENCTRPLKLYGSVLHLADGDYVFTATGNVPKAEYDNKTDQEKTDIENATGEPDDAFRDNIYTDKIEDSFEVGIGDRFENMGDDKMKDQSYNGRLYSITMSLTLLKDHPILGVGFGSYGSSSSLTWIPDVYREYGIVGKFYADNQFACVLAETGVVGFAVFIAFLLAGMWYYRKNLIKLIACIIIAWFGVFYNILEIQIGAMLLWSLLALDLGEITPKSFIRGKDGDK